MINIQPLHPPFPILSRLEHIRGLSRECDASCTSIVSKLFEVAKIAITVDDQLEQLDDSDSGTLFVGDHRQGIEYLPLLAKFGDSEKKNVHFVAKPFSMQARIMGHLAATASDLTLPVIPRTLSRDRKNIFNRDLFWRLTQALISACNNRQHPAGIQEITLRLGECGTVGDLFPDVDELSSMEITSRLHNQFIEKFGETF